MKRAAIETWIRQSLDMDAERYIKKKKEKLLKDNANRKRRYKATERGTDEGWRLREGRTKLEQRSPGKREAGAAERRRRG